MNRWCIVKASYQCNPLTQPFLFGVLLTPSMCLGQLECLALALLCFHRREAQSFSSRKTQKKKYKEDFGIDLRAWASLFVCRMATDRSCRHRSTLPITMYIVDVSLFANHLCSPSLSFIWWDIMWVGAEIVISFSERDIFKEEKRLGYLYVFSEHANLDN